MKLILTADVDKLGAPGDIVEVKGGYGRNFLLPRGLAIVATPGAERQIESIKRVQEAREVRDSDHANELKQKLERGDKVKILDVREPNEYQINRIPGATLIPLGDVARRYAELDPEEEMVVHCKMGGRSAKAADFLRSVGFKNVRNLTGGILEWIDKVDPTQPKY